ncbi:hypothetical protein BN440_0887 [Erwinia amylovora MR1]|nr:hypothetical protein BN440_0887 [Erwinia amylovora MR1]
MITIRSLPIPVTNMPESFRLNYPASVKVFFIFGTEFLIDNLFHRDMFSFYPLKGPF